MVKGKKRGEAARKLACEAGARKERKGDLGRIEARGAREEGQVSCLNSLPFPFANSKGREQSELSGRLAAERSSDFLSPLFFASYPAHSTAEPTTVAPGYISHYYIRGAKYGILRSRPPDIFSFHWLQLTCDVIMWISESRHFPLANILFIYFSRELKPVCLLANKYVPCKGHLISKITIKTVKRTIEPGA